MAWWRVAKSLVTLFAQLDAKYPNRAKNTDGTIGDAAHRTRESDHNPWLTGPDGKKVVSAADITTDSGDGADTESVVEALRLNKDRRIKYVIWRGRMFSSYKTSSSPAWAWRDYGGKNPHEHHFHLSVIADPAYYDDETPWDIELPAGAPAASFPATPAARPYLKKGSKRKAAVVALQTLLIEKGFPPEKGGADGDFGEFTEAAVRAFQTAKGLTIDGEVGEETWGALLK